MDPRLTDEEIAAALELGGRLDTVVKGRDRIVVHAATRKALTWAAKEFNDHSTNHNRRTMVNLGI
ncbi:hypothetical protein LCGC14_0364340 [marine sediment metagenome]|uniref:Uncharacterized protein n=1 Tax=marine sediment metagenome TaxID=412755 RepID=A0A0F9WFM2_9ZZZZ